MTPIHVHELGGCTPTPLGHYLKALGLLRLMAEQKDEEARGWWKDEHFFIATRLDGQALENFFLHQYAPTPILAPWNLGSGFYYEDDEAIGRVERSRAARFEPFRSAIKATRAATCDYAEAIAATREREKAAKNAKKRNASEGELKKLQEAVQSAKAVQAAIKRHVLARLRREWRGDLLRWLDAALVLNAEGDPDYPALLGTGGNDGRLDFTNNLMQHLGILFELEADEGGPRPIACALLQTALRGAPVANLWPAAVGQFLPGTAGGANMTVGFTGSSRVNPWDFVMMMEGSLLLASGMSRRFDTGAPPQAAAPFAVRARSSGYASAASADESARGEQWFPLWSRPSTVDELSALFSEGRARLGRRSAASALEFARSVARLGVARGIFAFERFGYIERNGQANLATPLGRWRVAAQPHQELLDDISGWLDRVRRAAGDHGTPESLRSAVHCADEGILQVCRGADVPARWQALLCALGDVESALGQSKKGRGDAWPMPPLSPGWVEAANDGGAELRLALALASQSVREHWLTLTPDGRRFEAEANAEVVCAGLDLERSCIALVQRRVARARSLGLDHLPLAAATAQCAAWLIDVDAFMARQTDDQRVLRLARGLMALGWSSWREAPNRLVHPVAVSPEPVYAVLRLTHLPAPLRRGSDSVRVAIDPEVVARLAAGDLAGAVVIALRRLRASGLRPVLREVAGDTRSARRLAAALAFPLSERDVCRCADLVTKPYSIVSVNAAPTVTAQEGS